MKQTEIGLIPDDWEVKRLNAICNNISSGKNQNRFVNGIYPVYGSTGIIGFCNNNKYSGDAILVARVGANAGLVNKVAGKYDVSDNTLVIQSDKCDIDYLSRLLAFRNLNQLIFGSGQSLITGGQLKALLIQLPSLTEQQRIAKALSDVDALIFTTEKLLQKKKNIKQGTMQELLTGKKRLPGFAKSSNTKMTELGEIPEDWEVKTLSEIFDFKPNNTFTRDCLNDSKGEYQNVHYGDVLIKYSSILDCSKESIPFINEGINVKFSKYGIMEGDIIIADTAEDETVGKAVEIYNLGNRKIVSGLHTFLCRKMTDDFAPRWLGYFMNQSIFHNQLLPFITGTKVSAISRTAIQNVKVLIPPKEEQTAIANVLSSMDKEIETLNTKLEKYRNLKTSMMQQLLTGKIRLR